MIHWLLHTDAGLLTRISIGSVIFACPAITDYRQNGKRRRGGGNIESFTMPKGIADLWKECRPTGEKPVAKADYAEIGRPYCIRRGNARSFSTPKRQQCSGTSYEHRQAK
jgi:hypothetical protein